jgi:hypothetical protein
MQCPLTIEELEALVRNRTEESLHLDYKRCSSLENKKEITKDVSAFANSDGGIIIYGIVEENHVPTEIETDFNRFSMTRERLEDIIDSGIAPRIDGIRINPIATGDNTVVYAIEVPKSPAAPHQDRSSLRYYKRHNFKSQPMEDYEIKDIAARKHANVPSVAVDVEIEHGVVGKLTFENPSGLTAFNIRASVIDAWPKAREHLADAPVFNTGLRILLPGKRIEYYLGPIDFEPGNDSILQIQLSYERSDEIEPITETFIFYPADFRHSLVSESEFFKQSKKFVDVVDKLQRSLESISKTQIDALKTISTIGLQLSPLALANINKLLRNEEPIQPTLTNRSYEFFARLLGIDHREAYKLMTLFQGIDDSLSTKDQIELACSSDELREETRTRLRAIYNLD